MEDEKDWYSQEASTFGDRLAAARDEAGLSISELARRLGVRQSTLHKWEDDQSEPRANRLSILAGLLNVSIMWLINGEGEGLENPDEVDPLNDDMAKILSEMRALRANMLRDAEMLGRLEKRMRIAMIGTTHD